MFKYKSKYTENVGVLPDNIKSNVSSVGRSSERNMKTIAYDRNVRLYYLYISAVH